MFMAKDANQVEPAMSGEPKRKRSNWPMWGGIAAAILAVVAVTAWFVMRPAVNILPPVMPTPTPVNTSVAVITPTPFAGAATFIPVASTVITGPHVLGITAGVGMGRGEIAGAAQIAVTFSDEMDQGSAQSAFGLSPSVGGDFRWQ